MAEIEWMTTVTYWDEELISDSWTYTHNSYSSSWNILFFLLIWVVYRKKEAWYMLLLI